MEQFPRKAESLSVGLGLVPGGVVSGNFENTDQNKYSLGAHVWDGGWQKVTFLTSAWNSATHWHGEIYIVIGNNFTGRVLGIYTRGNFSSGKSKFPPYIHWFFYLFKNVLSLYCVLAIAHVTGVNNRDQDKNLLTF